MASVIGMPFAGSSTFRQYMTAKYVRGVNIAGAGVRSLPQTTDPAVIARYVDECDGFLFPGGPDIDPALYGEDKEPLCGPQNEARDTFEYPLMQAVLAAGKPILCICRGHQLLNVVCGGTLLQDITGEQRFRHSDFEHRGSGTHAITITDDDNILRNAIGSCQCNVNSMHHQAIDRVGEGLEVIARAPEGYPEAVQLRGRPFVLGVQWHPEHMCQRIEAQENIFRAFVNACNS